MLVPLGNTVWQYDDATAIADGVSIDANNVWGAWTLSGARLTVRTIKELTHIHINHVINIDFHGFSKAVNALGCVYLDVDRHYYNQSNSYAKIDVQPGYQRLCGQDALSYVRYRHTDNDLVRAARQQDFLRQVKQQISAFGIISKRNQLLHIFSHYTASDLQSRTGILRLLRLAIASAGQPIREVHFSVKEGPSYVYARTSVIAARIASLLIIHTPMLDSSRSPRSYRPETASVASTALKSRSLAS